jgi:porin
MLGDLGALRPGLAEQGILLTLAYTGEVLGNVSGGLDTGSEYQGLLDFMIDADLSKSLGWNGASARLNPMWIEGTGLTRDYVGEISKVSNIDARDEARVFEAWLQQEVLEGAVSLRGGLMAADQEFALTATGALFLNSGFGALIAATANEPVPVYPLGALGVRLKVEPAPGLYLMGASYEGHPGQEYQNQSGMKVRLTDEEGTVTFIETGWVREGAYPGAIKAGFVYHSAAFIEHDSGEPEDGHAVVYVLAEQLLFRESPPDVECAEGLTAFVRVGGSEPERSLVTVSVDAGLAYTGLIPGREADVVGLGAVYSDISEDFADTQADPSAYDHELTFEATYKIVISRWWSLQPDFQYVIHPGGSDATDDAFVIGMRFDLLF